jgi:L-asparaginase
MRIKLLFTGGTIGSTVTDSIVNVAKSIPPKLVELYKNSRPNSVTEFSCESILNVLSENMTLAHLKILCEKLSEISGNDCSGVIITHGSDTLAYTACFLSVYLNPRFPVMLVCADYPLENPLSNGLSNFLAAVDFIENDKTPGVFVPFGKHGEQTKIHRGSELLEAEPFVHDFKSLNVAARNIPSYDHDLCVNAQVSGLTPFVKPEILPFESSSFQTFPFEKRILYIKSTPWTDYSVFGYKEKPDAILLGLYHSGTSSVSPSDERYSIIPFAKECIAQGIDFYAAPYDTRNPMYESAKEMQDAGIKFIPNVSTVCAYVKLVLAYGCFDSDEERVKYIFHKI